MISTATTPPMGWNSWDCYGSSVTEAEVLANARFMADRLRPYGWDTVVVDIQWYEPTARAGGYNAGAPLCLDGYGRPVPAPNRFPSARDGRGFAPLAAQVHDLGLRFGIHVMRGVPRLAVRDALPVLGTGYTAAQVADPGSTCAWNTDNVGLDHDHPGAQAYYDSLFAQFAAWGVDFVKADDMLYPYHAREIAAFSRALRGCGRPMVLSLSPGRALSLEYAEHLRTHADMWRVSDDLWDRWPDVRAQFDRMAMWAPYAGPGRWPDADMLPLGRIGIRAERGPDRSSRLSRVEQQTLLTLWCVARSPLMFGGDLPGTDPETLALLTNSAALGVLSTSTGNRQVLRDDDLVVWTAERTSGPGRYVALFNAGEQPLDAHVPWAAIGCAPGGRGTDLWAGTGVPGGGSGLAASLPPHGSLLLLVEPA
ncbi:MAG TPA: glycoside hydrolase family 27 protein [Rugosimonospora sp.]|nr:glycoside hydrolase family 27 protein [Rugosimonospora sp.]